MIVAASVVGEGQKTAGLLRLLVAVAAKSVPILAGEVAMIAALVATIRPKRIAAVLTKLCRHESCPIFVGHADPRHIAPSLLPIDQQVQPAPQILPEDVRAHADQGLGRAAIVRLHNIVRMLHKDGALKLRPWLEAFDSHRMCANGCNPAVLSVHAFVAALLAKGLNVQAIDQRVIELVLVVLELHHLRVARLLCAR